MGESYDTNFKRYNLKHRKNRCITRYASDMPLPWTSRYFAALALLGLTTAGVATSVVFAQQQPSAAALMTQADSVSIQVAQLRGLAIKKAIKRGVMNKTQIKDRILKLLRQEFSQAQLDAESLRLKRFGLIPESMNYVDVMVDLLKSQVAGFYDYREKKLFIAGWTKDDAELVMAHEIDHALQDQHFDLKRFLDIDRREGDALSARQALVEGDGIALMIEYKLASMKQAPPWGNPVITGRIINSMKGQGGKGMAGVPLSIRESLMFPYVTGLQFIATIRKHHSWSAVDAVYAKPPLSTEQVIHPYKYEIYERPHAVKAMLPSRSLPGFSEVVSTVQGEKGLELFLRTHGVSEAKAVRAVAGWGGDRMAVYARRTHKGSRSKGTIGVSLSSWDSENDAREYYEALEHALPNFSEKEKEMGSGFALQFRLPGGRMLVASRRGTSVLLVVGATSGQLASLSSELWSGWSVVK